MTPLASILLLALLPATETPRPPLLLRGIYGGAPPRMTQAGRRLADYGVNAVWVGSGGLTHELVADLHAQQARVFAEFNSMHAAEFLQQHPDAAPIGPDGNVCPPPDGWQGVCPTHPEYRAWRMREFRKTLHDFPIDGIWLDYHHAHASWEQAEPKLPDTCFCPRCLDQFADAIGLPRELENNEILDQNEVLQLARGPRRADWTRWRCSVFTDWVREFRAILDAERPSALLGTFHCPWTDDERAGALRAKLAIDLKAQAPYLDVLSPMPYHARFGHASDPAWIGRQVAWLGDFLGVKGTPGERLRIWPIVQLAEWGEPVPLEQVETVMLEGSRPPATGLTLFHGTGIAASDAKVEAVGAFYRAAGPPQR